MVGEMAFTGATLHRASARERRPGRVAAGRSDPEARAVLVSDGQVWVTRLEGTARPLLAHPADTDGETVLLGFLRGRPLFAVDMGGGDRPQGGYLAGLREVAGRLSASDGGLVAYAAGLLNWHRRHRYCSNCGATTSPELGGSKRVCDSCRTHHFPRTDPVVIVRVENEDRLLLGCEPGWSGMYSTLAGFVEPGETLEQAVRREVREEANVEVHESQYLASQPWPFPSSLMVGFTARGTGGAPRADGDELSDVRWFTREEVAAAAAGDGEFSLPPPFSIARWMITRWLDQA